MKEKIRCKWGFVSTRVFVFAPVCVCVHLYVRTCDCSFNLLPLGLMNDPGSGWMLLEWQSSLKWTKVSKVVYWIFWIDLVSREGNGPNTQRTLMDGSGFNTQNDAQHVRWMMFIIFWGVWVISQPSWGTRSFIVVFQYRELNFMSENMCVCDLLNIDTK